MPSVVAIENLTKRYRLGDEIITALNDVSLQVERGQFVAIMGASGSGKTTLLHLSGGLDLPDSGRVLLNGHSLTEMSDRARTIFRRRNLGIVFQSFNLLPTLTARENVMLPLLVDGRAAAEVASRADELIATVRLDQRSKHRPAALSGGEQQRVAIARALINNPVLILADEPTGNLDPDSSLEIWKLLRDLADRTKTTILMVTHEAAAAAYADCVHVLQAGRFVGVIETKGSGDAALVATRYAELGH
jgi:putative ABC transport system ATP-binding protein